ncbi:unnamed protein product [Polarella glacialis]|uniref:Uncharacterized protein n=1 Tax=Polarella glacialis TaxID=89957 RepID=A0A813I5R0_POLGL|nr:unnamed protein product [Polarella glacialis]
MINQLWADFDQAVLKMVGQRFTHTTRLFNALCLLSDDFQTWQPTDSVCRSRKSRSSCSCTAVLGQEMQVKASRAIVSNGAKPRSSFCVATIASSGDTIPEQHNAEWRVPEQNNAEMR